MPAPDELVESILSASDGLSVADLLARHPDLARRTAQRWLRELIDAGQITTIGEGRARRYLRAASLRSSDVDLADAFPVSIPLSEDSQDIIAYIDQPLVARRPVGYQREFIKLRRKPRRSGRGWIARGAKPLYIPNLAFVVVLCIVV